MKIKRFFSGSLYHRLILYFTLLMMIPISVAGTLIYSASDVRISDSALKLAAQVVEKDCESVNKILADMHSAVNYVAMDSEVQALISAVCGTGVEEQEQVEQLNLRLKQISRLYSALDGIYLCLDDGSVAKSRYYGIREGREEHTVDEEWYRDIRNHEDIQWIVSDTGSLVADNMGNAVLSAARMLPIQESGRPCGIVVVEVRQAYLNKKMEGDLGKRGTKFLLKDKQDLILYDVSADARVISDAVEQVQETRGKRMENIEMHDRVILCERLPSTEWLLVGVVFKNELRDDSQKILMIFLLTVLFTLCSDIIISRFLADFELRPIRSIQAYILEMEKGKFGLPLHAQRPDEIGDLAVNTQEMSVRIGELIETVKTEQERMRTAEFKALQAQINPHFLYNSLDSINWLARRGDLQKMTDMIAALTTFFRIGLSKGRDIITLREEIEHIRSYLIIQKTRYESEFEYFIFVPPELESCFVPKLMLQPLVENALYHGIKQCGRKCMLMIQVMEQKDRIEIEVLDNGVGMDEDTLEALREAMAHTGKNRANSYGVVNVNDRIQILAGAEYGLTFTSEKDIGTSARITLPKTLRGE